jgi:hypothetical protein
MDKADLDNRFTYHSPTPEQVNLYFNVRATAKRLAEDIDLWAPDGREKSLAITKLEEVVFWTNAAIARSKG